MRENVSLVGVSLWYSLEQNQELQRADHKIFTDIFEPQLSRSTNGVYTLQVKPLPTMQLVQTSKGWRALYAFSGMFAPVELIRVTLNTNPFKISVTVQGKYRRSKQDAGMSVFDIVIASDDFAAKISNFLQDVQ